MHREWTTAKLFVKHGIFAKENIPCSLSILRLYMHWAPAKFLVSFMCQVYSEVHVYLPLQTPAADLHVSMLHLTICNLLKASGVYKTTTCMLCSRLFCPNMPRVRKNLQYGRQVNTPWHMDLQTRELLSLQWFPNLLYANLHWVRLKMRRCG